MKALSLIVLAAFVLQACSTGSNGTIGVSSSSTNSLVRTIASGESDWAVSGYLHSDPKKKVYVSMSGDTIVSVGAEKPKLPAERIMETESIIFPGLMDMHGHIKYNILPLWDKALSQFLNRFEWRKKFPDYQNAVSFNMKPIKGDTVCAAVRWAEVKALAGGATALQGVGGDSKCAKDFGVNNVEIPQDFADNKVRAMTDMVMPDLVGSVFEKYMAPDMRAKKIDYDTAYKKMLEKEKVTDWIELFQKPHNLANGLKLLVGDDFGLKASENSVKDYDSVKTKIKEHLMKAPYSMKENAVTKQFDAMAKFLFGNDGKDSYLSAKTDEKTALAFISKGGVLTVPSAIRRYIGMFEISIRKSALEYYATGGKAIIAHLSEGQRKDFYNAQEYKYARVFGLTKPGLVIIHGVGLDKEDLKNAASSKISVVWSPFSNLLLYGETLDVAAAKAAGLNITIGSDWTPTGSKNIMDELKIARRYLTKKKIKITDKELVDMATVNAAKALRMENMLGKVAPKFKANLTLIDCKKGVDPNTCLVQAEQEQVALVVVNGNGLYGEPKLIESLAKTFDDDADVEQLPRKKDGCKFTKAIRFPTKGSYDTELSRKSLDFRSVKGIEDHLRGTMESYASTVKKSKDAPKMSKYLVELDPLFKCEDDTYAERFKDYIEKELDKNIADREKNRAAAKLDNKWSPVMMAPAEGEEEEE